MQGKGGRADVLDKCCRLDKARAEKSKMEEEELILNLKYRFKAEKVSRRGAFLWEVT